MSDLTFLNIFNLLIGVLIGFLLMAFIVALFIIKSLKIKRINQKVNEISLANYQDYYLKNKNSLVKTYLKEIKDVNAYLFDNEANSLQEISLNQMFNGIKEIANLLINIMNQPFIIFFKRIPLSSFINLKENIFDPFNNIISKRFTKFSLLIFNISRFIINLFNPIFYINKLLTNIIFKISKKDLILLSLSFVGLGTYKIYCEAKN